MAAQRGAGEIAPGSHRHTNRDIEGGQRRRTIFIAFMLMGFADDGGRKFIGHIPRAFAWPVDPDWTRCYWRKRAWGILRHGEGFSITGEIWRVTKDDENKRP